MSHEETNPDSIQISRRKMMGVVVGVINLGLIASVVGPVIGFAAAPLGQKRKQQWIALMDEKLIGPGEVKEVTYSLKIVDGYHEVEQMYTVYLRRGTDDVICIDPTCTHLGCRVKYQTEHHKFVCPCHGGVFDDEGNNKSGPPPKPLERHPVKIEGGKVWISRDV
ncbi:MAG: ubiquinol-cytochrome c reductase iron-sulfur subunit [Armatimonadetes bacterium]|nr:ubiquinol-cytochrome c reductase iron-sulfur subunit [Armatimonadota bacterium]